MRAKQEFTPLTRPHTPTEDQSTAFTPEYLATIRAIDNPASARTAVLAGPWEAEPVVGKQFAVSRRDEPMAERGRAFGVFRKRSEALQVAAVLPAVGAPMTLHLNSNGHRLGYTLHDGQEFLGHLARDEARLLPHLHLVRCLAADPEALALLLEAAGPETLALLGRVLQRRAARAAG